MDEGDLLDAAATGDAQDVLFTLDEIGLDAIEATDEDGFTPLLLACAYGHTDVVEVLLNKRGNMHHRASDGSDALLCAVQGGSCDVVRLLVDAKATLRSSTSDLVQAANDEGHDDVAALIQSLLAQESEPDASQLDSVAAVTTTTTLAIDTNPNVSVVDRGDVSAATIVDGSVQVRRGAAPSHVVAQESSALSSTQEHMNEDTVQRDSELPKVLQILEGGKPEVQRYLEDLVESVFDNSDDDNDEFSTSKLADTTSIAETLKCFQSANTAVQQERDELAQTLKLSQHSGSAALLDIHVKTVATVNDLANLVASDKLPDDSSQEGIQQDDSDADAHMRRLEQLSHTVAALEQAHHRLGSVRALEAAFDVCDTLITKLPTVSSDVASSHGVTIAEIAQQVQQLLCLVVESDVTHAALQFWASRVLGIVEQVRPFAEAHVALSLKAVGWPTKIVVREGETLEALVENATLLDDLSVDDVSTVGVDVLENFQSAARSLCQLEETMKRINQLKVSEQQSVLGPHNDSSSWLSRLCWVPVARRLRFHFLGSGGKSGASRSHHINTNRLDKPEWFLYYMVRVIHSARRFFSNTFDNFKQQAQRHPPQGTQLTEFDHFLTHCFRFAKIYFDHVWKGIANSDSSDDLLCHCVRQLLLFERAIDAGRFIDDPHCLSVSQQSTRLLDLVSALGQQSQPPSVAPAIERLSDSLVFSDEVPSILKCSHMEGIPKLNAPLGAQRMQEWLQVERQKLFLALDTSDATLDGDRDAGDEKSIWQWAIAQDDADRAARHKLAGRELSDIPLPPACIASLNVISEGTMLCQAFPSAEGQLAAFEGLIEPVLQWIASTTSYVVETCIRLRRDGKRQTILLQQWAW